MNPGRKTNQTATSGQSSANRLSISSRSRDTKFVNKINSFATEFLEFCRSYNVFILPQFQIVNGAETLKITPTKTGTDNNEQFIDDEAELESDRVLKKSGKIKDKLESEVTVFSFIYDDLIEPDALTYLRSKGCKVSEFMLDALKKCMKKYTTITTLKLQNCSINPDGIAKIAEILSEPDCSIKDLNLDMNPNIQQNHHLLCAPGTNLLYLSLKLCEINDDGVAKIASNLTYRDEPNAPKLIVLDLTNNSICELGAKKIGIMLRTNRSLRSLSLTGNRINDAGAGCILAQLNAFTLTENEMVENRRRKINRLKLGNVKVANLSHESLQMEFVSVDQKDKGRESRISTKKRRVSSRQVISNSSESSANQSTPVKVQSLRERTEAIISVDAHPLVRDVISSEGNLLCSGNLELQHLNLSFNKITEKTLVSLIECIQKQGSILTDDIERGLQYLNIEGNDFDNSSTLDIRLNEAMNHRRRKSK